MDNYFFRSTFPYCVQITDKEVIIKNRDYKTICICQFPGDVDVLNFTEFVKRNISIDEYDKIENNQIWLYDDATSPLGNENGFDSDLYDEYAEKLKALVNLLSGFGLKKT